jgi:hypothetical protein
MYESETEVAMPWTYNDGGFSESGLSRHRRKHGSPVVAAIAIAEQRRYSEVYHQLYAKQRDMLWNARSASRSTPATRTTACSPR